MDNNIASKKRICHLTSAHAWTDHRIFEKEAKSLAKAGYEVVFIVRRDQPATIDGVRIVPLSNNKGRIRSIFSTYWRLLRLTLHERAAVYHFHDPELIPVGLCLKMLGKRVIYDVHENYEQTVLVANWIPHGLHWLVSILWGGFERVAARTFDAIIVVDSNIREKFPAHKTEMITNVPPLSFCDVKPRQKPGEPFQIVYIGAVDRRRGVDKLIEALDDLTNRDVQLHLVGKVFDPSLHRVIDADSRIFSHGQIPWVDARRILENCHVGTLLFQPKPHHFAFTGEGNTKLFEYMSVAIPVIYSDFPKLRKFMESLAAGIAVDPTSPKEIAAAIDRLHNDPALCRTLGEAGRQAVLNRFNWENEMQKLLAVYDRILAGKTTAASNVGEKDRCVNVNDRRIV